MKQKRRMLAILVAAAMLIGGSPMGLFDAHAAEKHPCGNKADCTVCTVADMINALPEQDDITVDNAAAVTEQIHAIDRIKCDLSDDEYDELLTLVATKASDSGFGMDVPKLYMEAVEAVTSLNVGGSLFVQKSYHVGDAQLDWEESNAVFTIECIDPETAFEPLNVALADIGSSSLSGFYSAEADGWINKYILPAGTYKVTEIGYRAMTEDGDELSTTATYDVDGTVTSEYAIVEVADGEESTVAVMNAPSPSVRIAVMHGDEYVKGAKIQIFKNEDFDNTIGEWTTPNTDGSYEHQILIPDIDATYTIQAADTNELYYTSYQYPVKFILEEDDYGKFVATVSDGEAEVKNGVITISYDKIDIYDINLKDAELTYGSVMPKEILDLDTSTCNGKLLEDDAKGNYGVSMAIALIFKKGMHTYRLDKGDTLLPGTYSVTCVPAEYSQTLRHVKYISDDEVTVTVYKKLLTEKDFVITAKAAAEKITGAEDVEFSVDIEKETPGKTAGLEIKRYLGPNKFEHDDVNAEYKITLNKNIIEYTITGLSGEDAEKYAIDGGEITGTVALGSADSITSDKEKDPAADTSDNMNPFVWFMIMMAAAGAAVAARKIKA